MARDYFPTIPAAHASSASEDGCKIIARATRRKENVSFCYKRKIVVKKDEKDSEDEMFLRLMFLQVVDDYIEGLHYVDGFEENCNFAAQAIYVDCEGEVPDDTESASIVSSK